MKKVLELKFEKNFFAALLQTSAKKISYGFLVCQEGERCSYRPALMVSDVKAYVFDIENCMFVWLASHRHFEKAQVKKVKNKVIFKNSNAEMTMGLASFYRHYMTRCVNTLII
ncbi:MAG: hypothetical protein J6B00_02725 [Alphaproteobacteria bacterium]|nr:hypothetical protein [Alphaproteobacteria bacterium]MBO5441120.1 hypothetical protein [Alphaproteobacteria bacterium]MBP3688339.1 hypothetical protein [Alphaproteobacteria bacterium]